MLDLSEKETREKIINQALYDAGWKEEYIKREINSIRSDFKFKIYISSKGRGDIPEILERFEKKEKENPKDRKKKYFFVPVEEIKEKEWDLSISKYREVEHEEVKYEKPEVLKKNILELEREIIKGLEELKINEIIRKNER